jgi:hypothetical protein
MLASSAIAGWPGLYYRTQKANAPSVQSCLKQANTVMQELKFSDIRTSGDGVGGHTANEHAAITCLSTGKGTTAILMVAGEEAREVLGRLSKALSKKETVLMD